MGLKNSKSQSKNIFDNIQKQLATHGAKKVMFDYNQSGQIIAISFGLDIGGRLMGFKLPAKIENVVKILYGNRQDRWGRPKEITDQNLEQAYRTGWANIRDWISAQMALIDIGMVKTEEVFLSYITDEDGKTLFEKLENKNFLLPSGK